MPYEIAVDASGNVWVTNVNSHVLSKFSNSGVAVPLLPATRAARPTWPLMVPTTSGAWQQAAP